MASAPPLRLLAALALGLAALLAAPPAGAQDARDIDEPATLDDGVGTHGQAHLLPSEPGHGEAHGDGDHGPPPPVWLVIPFVVLLGMIATGPLFYPHFWHHYYPHVAVALGVITSLYYLVVQRTIVPIEHAAVEYFSFIALLGSLFIASGCILVKTDFAGTARANSALLGVGAVISNFIGTTGASMLLIRPYMRLNAGRLKAYHIVFFIFVVSNVGGALTPIGDPPLFLGFLRGVPFFWTVEHVWYIWLPTVAVLIGVFYVVDRRNKAESIRGAAEDVGRDVEPGEVPGAPAVPEAPGVEDVSGAHADEVRVRDERPNPKRLEVQGKAGFAWLAVIIAAVFVDPNIIPWVPDIHSTLHVPFGIREVIMGAVAFAAYRTADEAVLRGNDFNFEPIKEVGFLFIGIFLTMQPALELIRLFAEDNGDALNPTAFFFGTGVLSGFLDNAPTYVAFLSAALGKFGLSVGDPDDVAFFSQQGLKLFYLQAISVAAVFFGALTYIGNGPNFMVKAIAESAGVKTPSFVEYVVKYSLPILIPIYIVVWLVFFSGWIIPIPTS